MPTALKMLAHSHGRVEIIHSDRVDAQPLHDGSISQTRGSITQRIRTGIVCGRPS